jgi:hypothetical protein
LAKYENIASAIVAIGSRFLEIALIPRWTEKKRTTIKLARSDPQAPGPFLIAIEPPTQSRVTTKEGMSAPLHISCSEEFPTLALDMGSNSL